jgi:hypothetical protein
MCSLHLELFKNELPKILEARSGSERTQITDFNILQSEANQQPKSVQLGLKKSNSIDESNVEDEGMKEMCERSPVADEKPSFFVDKRGLHSDRKTEDLTVESYNHQETVVTNTTRLTRKGSLHMELLEDFKRSPSYQWKMGDEKKQVNQHRHLSSRRHHHPPLRQQQQQQHDSNTKRLTSRAHSGGRRALSPRVDRRKRHDMGACEAMSFSTFFVNRDDLPNTVGLDEERSSMIDVMSIDRLTVTSNHSTDELDNMPTGEGTSDVDDGMTVEQSPAAADVDANWMTIGNEERTIARRKVVQDRASFIDRQTTADVREVVELSCGKTSRQRAKTVVPTGTGGSFAKRNFLADDVTTAAALDD